MVEESLQTVRGRIDFGAQLKRRPGQPLPLECRYQEFGEDTEMNRLLKAAVRRVLQLPNLERSLLADLRRQLGIFTDVGDKEFRATDVPSFTFNRLNSVWEPAVRIAQLILAADSVRDRLGDVAAVSFTVDMNVLFERFVEVTLGEAVRNAGWDLEPQAPRHLTPSVAIRPDLVLRHRGVDHAVGDAKYKLPGKDSWVSDDAYQLLAYCAALELDRGLLIYADDRPHRGEEVAGVGIRLETIGIDISLGPGLVLESSRRAAEILMDQAVGHLRKQPLVAV